MVDMDGNIIEVNDSYCQLVGYTRDELLIMHLSSVDAIDTQTDVERRMEEIVRKGSLRFETKHRHKNGTVIEIEASTNYSPTHGGLIFSFVRNITYQKRNRQLIEARLKLGEYSHYHSLREVLRETLDEAETLTGSCIGFYHFMDSDTQMLTLQAWSTRTAAEFCKAEGAGSHYPIEQAGVWVDCVRERRPVVHNDYASLPHRKGMPEGHAAVVRELVVPIFRKDKIVAIIGVGNKQTDYDRQDIEVITILADLAWEVAERKLAEVALFESLERYRTLSETMLQGVVHQDATGKIIAMNAAAEGILGKSREEFLGSSSIKEEHHSIRENGEKFPGTEHPSMLALQTGQPVEHVIMGVLNPKLNEYRWIRIGAVPVFHSGETTPSEVFTVFDDFTERKRLEDALAGQADFTVRVFNSIDAHLAVIGPDGTILKVNDSWQQFSKDNMGDLRDIWAEGSTYFVDYNERWGDASQAREAFEGIRNVQSGIIPSFSLEYPCHAPNGEHRWFLLKVFPLAGESGTVLISHTNISKRKQAEEQLQVSEAHFRLLTENVSDVLWRLDSNYCLTYISPADERLRGYRADELIGHHIFELMLVEGAASSIDVIRQRHEAMQQGINVGSFSFEAEQICKDGRTIWTEIISTPEIDVDGKLTGFHGVTRDISERKKAEAKLHDALNYIQTLLKTSPTGIATYRTNGEIVFANEAAARIAGTTTENLLKQNFRELESWKRAGLIDMADRALITGAVQHSEIKMLTTFGNEVYLGCQLVPFTFNNEQLLLFEAMDISDRKRAEEALKSTADFLEESQRIGRMGSYDYDILSGNWTSTETLDDIFGIAADYVKSNEGWLTIIVAEQREQIQEYLSQLVITGKQKFDKDYMICRKSDGALRWVQDHGKLHFDAVGTPVKLIGTIQDITERRLAEEVLRYKFAELSAIYTHAPMMMCLVDSDRRILYANPAFRVIQCVSEEELIGGHACGVFGCVNAKDDPQGCGHGIHCRDCTLLKAIEETFQTGTGHINEEHHIVVNGEGHQREFTLLGSTSLIYSGDQRHLLLSLLDISEQKKAEEEKRSLEQQLHQAQKLESLGVLAGGIAHDFNNILAIIVGNCFLAKMHPDKAESNISTIENASERAAELCRQMLAYAGKNKFIEELVNMSQLVDEMVKMLQATIPQNVVINLICPADTPRLRADASQLRQIVMNLIINASEAIGEAQGKVLVTLKKTAINAGQEQKDHLGKPIPPGSYICLEVTDDGCGMDEDTIRRIFEPFYTTKFVGRGLGMSAVLGIITAHKGALQLVSQPGFGTSFKMYLPIESNELAGCDAPEQLSSVAWTGSGTILLVEDEEQIKQIMAAMLTSLGFSVLGASNGKEALEMYQKYAADITLVLTDIGMPVMDGYELFNKLKELKPELPIIISSGFGENVITSRIARADIAGLIIKPFKFDLLSNLLKSVVENQGGI